MYETMNTETGNRMWGTPKIPGNFLKNSWIRRQTFWGMPQGVSFKIQR